MNLVKEVFQCTQADFTKLTKFGFSHMDGQYNFTCDILDGDFRVDIAVTESGDVRAKVIDSMDDSEYSNVNVDAQQGEFVSRVRDTYREVLEAIRERCFIVLPFVFAQSNRITRMIYSQFEDAPEPFMSKGAQAFKVNDKWYGIIVNIHRYKIVKESDKSDGINTCNDKNRIEVLNIKVDSDNISELLKQTGYYPAYHMNKKHWVSIILDDTLTDAEVMNRVVKSHTLASKEKSTSVQSRNASGLKEWVVPSNPKYFNVIKAFEEQSIIGWKQSASIAVGDIVYLYIGAPYSAIMYRCEVVEVDILPAIPLPNVKFKKRMRIKRLSMYDQSQFSFSKLKTYGVNSVRSARGITAELSEALRKNKI